MAQLRYECSHCTKLSCNHTAAVQHNRDAHGGQANILPERSKSQMRANDFAQRAKIANLISQRDAYRAMALKVEDAEVVAHERWLEIERLRASQADAGARVLAVVRQAHETLIEINPNNYTHDEVVEANDAAVESIFLLADLIGETHGKSSEWWKQRRAALAEQEKAAGMVGSW